jgi:hypothetical protein
MTALFAFSIYALLVFFARFTCLNGLVYCVCKEVVGGQSDFLCNGGVLGGGDGEPQFDNYISKTNK